MKLQANEQAIVTLRYVRDRQTTHQTADAFLYAENPSHTFPRNFPVDGEVSTCPKASWQKLVVMEFWKRHDTTYTTDFCPRQLVTDLSFTLWTCYGETGVMDFGLYQTKPLLMGMTRSRTLNRCTWPKSCGLIGRLYMEVSSTGNLGHQIKLRFIWCKFLIEISGTSFLSVCHRFKIQQN